MKNQKRTTKTNAAPSTSPNAAQLQADLILKTESRIEQYKQKLFDAATSETPALTLLYSNWLNTHTNTAKRDAKELQHMTTNARTVETLHMTAEAWTRAHELFNTLAPVVLDELAHDIAAQVRAEFTGRNDIAAADVYAEMAAVNFLELVRHE